jgi:hypothetical protein
MSVPRATRIPDNVRDRLRDLLWERAEEIGWSELNDGEKARLYEQWTRDANIGGELGHYMDPRKVRVYIKDSLLKPYERARLSGTEQQILERLAVEADSEVDERYIKPHGIRFSDGRIISWGNSRDWKSVVMAMYERAAQSPGSSSFGMVLLENGKTATQDARRIVREAARRLGIERLEWID